MDHVTCLPRQGGGWLYLAVWLDRSSRKIVGWDVRDTMPEDLVSEALRRALAVRRPGLLCTPTRAASTRPPASGTYWPATVPCRA
ncbi:DDE-type integrase/transposase/recombinase [Hymenobacter sp. BT635]|uniref:DDE-type integrase/transposase/recombinase n=1 Tax=Hymenobacter nitidus TaxID=2880929 RepID=A0ABS8AMI4_9BACT|nr:DDE-type integrase/transposase/recombinase [Hymenobacter nitidus]